MRDHLTQWASGPTVGSDQSQSSAILKLYVLDKSYQISLSQVPDLHDGHFNSSFRVMGRMI